MRGQIDHDVVPALEQGEQPGSVQGGYGIVESFHAPGMRPPPNQENGVSGCASIHWSPLVQTCSRSPRIMPPDIRAEPYRV